MQDGKKDVIRMDVDRGTGEILSSSDTDNESIVPSREESPGGGIPSVAKKKKSAWFGLVFALPLVAVSAYLVMPEEEIIEQPPVVEEGVPAGFHSNNNDIDDMLKEWGDRQRANANIGPPKLTGSKSKIDALLAEEPTGSGGALTPPSQPTIQTATAPRQPASAPSTHWNNGMPKKAYLDALALGRPLSEGGGSGSASQANAGAMVPVNPYAPNNDFQKALLGALTPESGGVALTGNAGFKEKVANQAVKKVTATQITNMPYTILQGTMIHCVLDTAIDSTLPGNVVCTVTRDVYGMSGSKALIPRGSKMYGQHNSAVKRGQARVFVVWSRLITPRGLDVPIGSSGTDNLGRAGFGGEVDQHFWQRFGNASLLSVLGATLSTAGVNQSDQANSANTYRESISMSFQNSATRSLEENIDIPDTIYKDQGETVVVIVDRDLDFSSVLAQR